MSKKKGFILIGLLRLRGKKTRIETAGKTAKEKLCVRISIRCTSIAGCQSFIRTLLTSRRIA